MKVDSQLVDKIAGLAKLRFEDKDKDAIINDMQRMLEFVEKLNELDTEGVESQIYISEPVNALRKDEAANETSKADALKNAPMKDSDYIKVPKVINRADE